MSASAPDEYGDVNMSADAGKLNVSDSDPPEKEPSSAKTIIWYNIYMLQSPQANNYSHIIHPSADNKKFILSFSRK